MKQREWLDDARLLQEALEFLALKSDATVAQVRAAWKRRLKAVHPDVGGNKEAAQHAGNMRDVLLSWIDAGRPNLEPHPHFAFSNRPSRAGHRAWQDIPACWPSYCWKRWLIIVAIWAMALFLSVYPGPRNLSKGQLYGLPACSAMTMLDETRAALNGQCWPPVPLPR